MTALWILFVWGVFSFVVNLLRLCVYLFVPSRDEGVVNSPVHALMLDNPLVHALGTTLLGLALALTAQTLGLI